MYCVYSNYAHVARSLAPQSSHFEASYSAAGWSLNRDSTLLLLFSERSRSSSWQQKSTSRHSLAPARCLPIHDLFGL